MTPQNNRFFLNRVIVFESTAIFILVLFIWLDELMDLPYSLFKSLPTPVNWLEALFESSIILIFGLLIIFFTIRILQRMKLLEGILPICSSCKKIRDERGDWHNIEDYIGARSEADFSHGICPACAKRLYPEIYDKK